VLNICMYLICVCGVCFAVGDESQALDTRVFAARPADEGSANTDITVPETSEVLLDKTSAANWYSLIP